MTARLPLLTIALALAGSGIAHAKPKPKAEAPPTEAAASATPAIVVDPHMYRGMDPLEAKKLEPKQTVKAVLTQAPEVPPPTGRTEPAKVIVEVEVQEVVKKIADGTEYVFWTYGGDVPGSFIRVRQGDTVEFHLQNHPQNKMPHNIDLHAVTGQGGGAGATATAPGHESVFTFKAINAGLYVYHCATAPVPMHIGNGMYGLILVEPPQGLPPVDKEFYVMQGDFYTEGAFKGGGVQTFAPERAVDEDPTYVLFNGGVGAIAGENALKAEVGDSVRLYFGVGGPNLTSSFHVIGEIFDRVYTEGGLRYQEQVQTTMVPSGGSAIMEFTLDTPATYVLVDHSLSRAFDKGAVGMLKVDGPADLAVNSGKQIDRPWAGSGPLAQGTAATDPKAAGAHVYATSCQMCHQPDGKGVPGAFPPLAGSDWVVGKDVEKLIRVPVEGLSGPIVVSGQHFNGAMPPVAGLSDEQLAQVLTWVRSSWGNKGDAVTPAQVKSVRAKVAAASTTKAASADPHGTE